MTQQSTEGITHPVAKARSSASSEPSTCGVLAKADINSVDPDEPWRYACPRCESTCVYVTPNGGYTCRGCRDPIDHVWDRKHESIARP